MATDTSKLVDQLGKMTVLELVELKNALEEAWGVTAAAPVAVAAQPHDKQRLLAEDHRPATARKRSIIAFTCSGTRSWQKCPAPTVWPVTSCGQSSLKRATSPNGRAAEMLSTGTRHARAVASPSQRKICSIAEA